ETRAGTCSAGEFDLHELLEAALDRLPAVQRTVLLLRDYEDYSYREIAAITGLTEVQVKVYIFRARGTMKAFIGSPDRII
ncbi:MAG: sigma-70 region 4 domain-containing protein, partial [Odoribacteraceae bacterium]|nr:sigma-70 region 4 domain-containing protein [Odoribacteraceae bacterium]